ncbi:MAG: DNA/RNA non-specific endonuclease [Gammaproteobacteria bacterium]|nr:DNA/RNA non-specific endonuclease [Gammaproteobacteria bacterium]
MQIGYDEIFIGEGIRIPLPTFNRQLGRSILRAPGLRKNIFSDHAHFTVVMNEYTRQLVYSAYNIDQSNFLPRPPGGGKRSWRNDPNVKAKFQLDNDYYKDRQTPTGKIPNPYDRGHMVMRFNNMWGADNDESDKAGKATFIYSNSSLQHENLNRDEWKALEIGIVREFEDDKNNKLAVFTGPIYGDLDRHINLTDQESARVPSGFFKVICYRRKTAVEASKLGVLAFAIFQDTEVLRDKKGGKQVKTNREYQVTISELQNWTGINFDRKMYDANPLFYNNIASRNRNLRVSSIPERIPVTGPGGVVGDATERRPEVTHLSTRRIVINSAMIDPQGSERRGEWISLHNRGNRKTSIRGWRLIDGKGRVAELTDSIGSGESKRLKGRALGKVRLSNSGGSLALQDSHGCLIDHVTWSRPQIRRLEEGVAFLFDSQSN